jgi:hypothetical protein
MAAITVHFVEHGWAGDLVRKRCILGIGSATTDSLTAEAVGLHEIVALKPTGRLGTIDAHTVVSCSHGTYNIPTTKVIIFYNGTDADAALSTGNVEVDIFGR